MDRITIRVSDDLGSAIARHARAAGVSRARWLREIAIEQIARADSLERHADHEQRLRRIERRLAIPPRV